MGGIPTRECRRGGLAPDQREEATKTEDEKTQVQETDAPDEESEAEIGPDVRPGCSGGKRFKPAEVIGHHVGDGGKGVQISVQPLELSTFLSFFQSCHLF